MALIPGHLQVVDLTSTSVTVQVVGVETTGDTPGLHAKPYRFRSRVDPDAFPAWPVFQASGTFQVEGLAPGVTVQVGFSVRTAAPIEQLDGPVLEVTTPGDGPSPGPRVGAGELSSDGQVWGIPAGRGFLPEIITPGVTAGHLRHHEVLHEGAGGGLPVQVVQDSAGHLQHHVALKSWYDAAHASSPLPAAGDPAGHARAHELLHAWVNAATPVEQPPGTLVVTTGQGTADVAWTSEDSAAGWQVGRDGIDSHGAGPWSTILAGPAIRSFQFTRLSPLTEYTFTVTNLSTGDKYVASATQPAAPAPVDPPPVSGDTLWTAKITTAPLGNTSAATFSQIMGPTFATSGTAVSNSEVVADGGSRVLRQKIPANTLGSLIASPRLPRRVEDATISFDVRFDAGFIWRHGLKVGAGLVGVRPGAGIYTPTSGQSRDNGCSLRIMAHGSDGSTRPFQGALGPLPAGQDNEIVSYVYARDPNAGFSGFGWHVGLGSFTRNVWTNIKIRGRMNTPGQKNGVIQYWVDDVLKYSKTNADLRGSNAEILWDAVLWDTHRGGGTTANWLSSRNDYLDLRNVVVTGS